MTEQAADVLTEDERFDVEYARKLPDNDEAHERVHVILQRLVALVHKERAISKAELAKERATVVELELKLAYAQEMLAHSHNPLASGGGK